MITMMGHALEGRPPNNLLLAGPLCEACEWPLSDDAVIRWHRREHRPHRQPGATEMRVRLVGLSGEGGDDPRSADWPRVGVERETILSLLGQFALCAFTEAEAP